MNGYVVYVDQVLLGNMVMDYVILLAASRCAQIKVPNWRLWVGAVLGGLYSLVIFVPGFELFLGVSAKILVSLLMIAVTFAPQPMKKLFTCLGFFYLVSFTLGGAVLGFSYFMQSNPVFADNVREILPILSRYFWPGMAFALVTCWLGSRLWRQTVRRRLTRDLFHVPLLIRLWGRSVKVEALLDTGNQLSDPITGDPVIVVEYEVLKDLLPGPIAKLFEVEDELDFNGVIGALSGTPWASRFRLVPFQSLGQDNGMLMGFRPDRLDVLKSECPVSLNKVVVGVYRKKLNIDSTYRALLHPDLLEAA